MPMFDAISKDTTCLWVQHLSVVPPADKAWSYTGEMFRFGRPGWLRGIHVIYTSDFTTGSMAVRFVGYPDVANVLAGSMLDLSYGNRQWQYLDLGHTCPIDPTKAYIAEYQTSGMGTTGGGIYVIGEWEIMDEGY